MVVFSSSISAQRNLNSMSLFQRMLINLHGALLEAGILDYPFVKALSVRLYYAYKKWYEDPFPKFMNTYGRLFKNGHILDVGACLGFNSILFSRALSPGYQVYAFEPEASNYLWLNQMIYNAHAEEKILSVNVAVGSIQGMIRLWHNTKHFGDHRIVTDHFETVGIKDEDIFAIPIISIDHFVHSNQWQPSSIAFIKMDVQGYELEVCHGMEKTLLSNPEATIAVEYAPNSMMELGFEPRDLLKWFHDRGYHIYAMHRNGQLSIAESSFAEGMLGKRGYVDLICNRTGLVG